ncbi:hypothetical protein GCWU000325_02358 [Alloprevotella tannerae ATCC 51259]|uniref:Uncharacterized protein n=1 Tax=Alloprevotella tannerae ATCC 51259 TaxID=626522 RepID=C9LJE6_9BACT|nr:hypothetical protein GCWU000325_02358 [Alloprevotella tannerae ATCC 51259]
MRATSRCFGLFTYWQVDAKRFAARLFSLHTRPTPQVATRPALLPYPLSEWRRCLSENVVLEVLPETYFALILRAFMPILSIARLSNLVYAREGRLFFS